MAIDLEDLLCVEGIKSKLAAFESLEGKGIDLDKASQSLASIRGSTLGVTVTDRRNGAIRIDFNEEISAIRGTLSCASTRQASTHQTICFGLESFNKQGLPTMIRTIAVTAVLMISWGIRPAARVRLRNKSSSGFTPFSPTFHNLQIRTCDTSGVLWVVGEQTKVHYGFPPA